MPFDATRFMGVFGRHGLAKDAQFGSYEAKVGFTRPDKMLYEQGALAPDYQIEFEASAFPGIKAGDAITVDGAAYKLRANPMTVGDGTFRIADLTKVA